MTKLITLTMLTCAAFQLHAASVYVKVEPTTISKLETTKITAERAVPGLFLKTISSGPLVSPPGSYRLLSLLVIVAQGEQRFGHTVRPEEFRVHFSRGSNRWVFSWPKEVIDLIRTQAIVLGRNDKPVTLTFKYLQLDPAAEWKVELNAERTAEFLRPGLITQLSTCAQSLLLFRGSNRDFRDF